MVIDSLRAESTAQPCGVRPHERESAVTKLTARQERFVREYMVDLNGTQAAIRAGYSPGSAKVTASRMLTQANVAAELSRLSQERLEVVEVNAEWVLRRLVQLADVDIGDVFRADGSLKAVVDMSEGAKRLIAGIEVTENTLGRVVTGYTRKVKLSDRLKVLELIGRHVTIGAWQDNVSVADGDGLIERIIAARKRAQAEAEVIH